MNQDGIMHSPPSFTTKAIIAAILYFVLFVPGFVAVIIWHNEGKRAEKLYGQPLPGVGALRILRALPFVILLILLALAVVWFATSPLV